MPTDAINSQFEAGNPETGGLCRNSRSGGKCEGFHQL